MGGGEKLSECLLLGWKILNLVLKVVKPKILDVFAPEGRVPYLVFRGAGFSNQGGEGALGAVGRHYKKCPLLLAFFQNCPPPPLEILTFPSTRGPHTAPTQILHEGEGDVCYP